MNEALTLLVREGIGDALRPFAVTNITPPRVGGDLPGGDLERSEQAGGAVADVVVGLLLGNALAQRQDRLRSVQSLDLALLITSTAAPITYEAWSAGIGSMSGIRAFLPESCALPARARWADLDRARMG